MVTDYCSIFLIISNIKVAFFWGTDFTFFIFKFERTYSQKNEERYGFTMAFLEWHNTYSVGKAEIDNQHKHVLFIVNHFLETIAIEVGGEDLYRVIDSTVSELIDYTIYHFSTEEKVLSLYDYPGLDEHRKEHLDLIDKVLNFTEV